MQHIFHFLGWLSLCGGLSFAYNRGVRFDVSLDRVAAAGCTVCYDAPFRSVTRSEDITKCFGPNLFVGTITLNESSFAISAIASRTVVLNETYRRAPQLFDGIYWYFTKSHSFGFLAAQLHHKTVNMSNYESTFSSDSGLSWNLDLPGGQIFDRSPKMYLRADVSRWRKLVYNCPQNSCTSCNIHRVCETCLVAYSLISIES
jgi:hypothetical protein